MGDSLSWAADQEREREQQEEAVAKKSPERLVSNIRNIALLADSALKIRTALGARVPAADRELVDMMLEFTIDQIPGAVQGYPAATIGALADVVHKHNAIEQLMAGQSRNIKELHQFIKDQSRK